MQAEFVACYEATFHTLWLKSLPSKLYVIDAISNPIINYCDKSSMVFYSKKNKRSSNSKHFESKYLMVKDNFMECRHFLSILIMNQWLFILTKCLAQDV